MCQKIMVIYYMDHISLSLEHEIESMFIDFVTHIVAGIEYYEHIIPVVIGQVPRF